MCKIAFLRSVPSLIAFAAVLFFSTAYAATFVSPSIGLTAGQTARLSVVNNGSTTETETLTLFDNMGNMLATRTQAVDPGHRLSLDFTTNLDRLEIHGIIIHDFPASLQIFDSTSLETMALVENFLPSPPAAVGTFVSPSIGLTAGQTARFSVVNTNTISETETLSIVNAMGDVLRRRNVTLAPGQVGSLDFTTASSRLEIHGMIGGLAPVCAFPASVQVFDSTNMQTMALVENFLPSPPETTTGNLVSPSIGFGAGQIARLSVTNTNTISETETLSIVNGLGVTLRTATITIAPGRTAFIQATTSSSRLEIHGMIGGVAPVCTFPADLQVFDAETLQTMALVEKFLPSPPATTDTLTSPSIGFGAGQTARLSVVNTNTISETQTLSIVNGLGMTIRTATLTIAPGRTAFIQTTTSNSRLEIHGVIGAVAPVCNFPADLQVFDSTSMQTLARLEDFFVESPSAVQR